MNIRTVKEVVRHALHLASVDRLYFYLSGKPRDFVAGSDLSEKFSTIYKSGHWQNGDRSMPLSGQGSTLDATLQLRARLPAILRDLGVKTVLDIGCGDFTWMSQVDLGDISYIGTDIVPSVIAANTAKYQSARKSFVLANAVSDLLPKADAVICREVLFHLSFSDAKALLRNALDTGASHFFLTTDDSTGFNSDIHSGDYRFVNLKVSPFRFPAPRVSIPEIVEGRFLCLWSREEIEAALNG